MKEHKKYGFCIHHNETTFEHFECDSLKEALDGFNLNKGKVYCVDLNRYNKSGRVTKMLLTAYEKDNHKRRLKSMKTLKEKLNKVYNKHPFISNAVIELCALFVCISIAQAVSNQSISNETTAVPATTTVEEDVVANTNNDSNISAGVGEIVNTDIDADVAENSEVTSGTVMVPIEGAESDSNYYIKSSLQSYKDENEIPEFKIELPEGYEEQYVDEYSVNFGKAFPEDVDFEIVDADGNEYCAEYIYANTNAVRNTPYVDSVNYMKAQMMNYIYNDIFDLEVNGVNYIVAYTSINQNTDTEEYPEYFPKTSICFMYILGDDVPCDAGDCSYTEVMEVYADIHATLTTEEEITSYVKKLIEGLDIELVRG